MSMQHWQSIVCLDFIRVMKNFFVICINDNQMVPIPNMHDWKVDDWERVMIDEIINEID